MYYAYTNLSCEGVVVIKEDDKKFPIGYDPSTGNIAYVNSLTEALKDSVVIKEIEDIEDAVKYDSAGYTRYPKDPEEGKVYRKLLNIEWSKPLSIF